MTTTIAAMAARRVIQFYQDHGGEIAWTKEQWARDKWKHRVPVKSNDAICWCVDGAIGAAIGWQEDEGRLLFNEIARHVPDGLINRWNDAPERTYDEVIGLLNRIAMG